ncbi:tryptophan synthase subunit alpha, partial [Peptococcaceae bacterium]|nr:tryptophan synthase subunit alpha [Peptococcaceae bacterium]
MTNRIDERFDKLKSEAKKGFIPFITAGDPDLNATVELVNAMANAGADIIELGVPYSEPV